MPVEGANSDLHQARRVAALHDPGERRGVAQRIAFEIVVEVGVSVKVEDVDWPVHRSDSCDHRKTDHVIAAKDDRNRARLGCRGASVPDSIEVAFAFIQRKVADILDMDVGAEFEPAFGGEIAMVRRKRRADRSRRGRRSPKEGRMAVSRSADQLHPGTGQAAAPNGSSIDGGGMLNQRGPEAVM